jgi:hypothetical protein
LRAAKKIVDAVLNLSRWVSLEGAYQLSLCFGHLALLIPDHPNVICARRIVGKFPDQIVEDLQGVVSLIPFQIDVPRGIGERSLAWRFADSFSCEL